MPRVTSLKFASALLLGVLILALAQASAYAAPVVYTARLSGPAESPPNASPGTGSTEVTLDLAPACSEAQPLRISMLAPPRLARAPPGSRLRFQPSPAFRWA